MKNKKQYVALLLTIAGFSFATQAQSSLPARERVVATRMAHLDAVVQKSPDSISLGAVDALKNAAIGYVSGAAAMTVFKNGTSNFALLPILPQDTAALYGASVTPDALRVGIPQYYGVGGAVVLLPQSSTFTDLFYSMRLYEIGYARYCQQADGDRTLDLNDRLMRVYAMRYAQKRFLKVAAPRTFDSVFALCTQRLEYVLRDTKGDPESFIAHNALVLPVCDVFGSTLSADEERYRQHLLLMCVALEMVERRVQGDRPLAVLKYMCASDVL